MVSQLQRFLKIPLLPLRRRKLKAVPVPLSLPFPRDRKARHPDQVPARPFHDRPKAKAVKPVLLFRIGLQHLQRFKAGADLVLPNFLKIVCKDLPDQKALRLINLPGKPQLSPDHPL